MRRSVAPSQRSKGVRAFVPPRISSTISTISTTSKSPLTERQPCSPITTNNTSCTFPTFVQPASASASLTIQKSEQPACSDVPKLQCTPSPRPKRAKFVVPIQHSSSAGLTVSTTASKTHPSSKTSFSCSGSCKDDTEKPWRYFSVVWCKFSRKKHKTWEGDALLMVRGKTAMLKDMEGKDISKSSTMNAKDLSSLSIGETLYFSGKEIEIMNTISEDAWSSGKCFISSTGGAQARTATDTSAQLVVSKRFKKVTKANPNDHSGQQGNHHTSMGKEVPKDAIILKPRFDPTAPNALVINHPAGIKHQSVPIVVDPHVAVHLRPHQREGVVFLWHSIVGRPGVDGTGCILGDEMGLGKTIQCISLIWTALKQGHDGKPLARRVMVVCPGSLVSNWNNEFRKWLGPERIKVFVVQSDKPVKEFAATNLYSVVLLSYEMLLRNIADVSRLRLDIVVCDEAHRLKNANAKTTLAMMSLQARRRIALTGTPVQNDLQEFFAIVDFCNPGILGSQATFRHVFERPILDARQPSATDEQLKLGNTRAKELTKIIASFCLRRTKEINLSYLPPKSDFVVFCNPSLTQLRLYRALLKSSAVRSCLQGRITAGMHLVVITALKTLCNSPTILTRKAQFLDSTNGNYEKRQQSAKANGKTTDQTIRKSQLHRTSNSIADSKIQSDTSTPIQHSTRKEGDGNDIDEEYEYDLVRDIITQELEQRELEQLDDAQTVSECGKMHVLSHLLRYWRNDNAKERVLIVSNSTRVLDRIQALCENHKYTFLRLQGNTPTSKRQQLVNRFNRRIKDDFIFLMSSKAGGVGLNITGASRLILYDTDWNPANDLQAMARVWRDGQKRHVYIYRLLTTGTIEEKIYQRQVHKQGLSGSVVDKQQTSTSAQKQVAGFSMEDLKDIFSLREDTKSDTWDLLQRFGSGDRSTGPSSSLSLDTLLTWHRALAPFQADSFDDVALRAVDQAMNGLITCVFHTTSTPPAALSPSNDNYSQEQSNSAVLLKNLVTRHDAENVTVHDTVSVSSDELPLQRDLSQHARNIEAKEVVSPRWDYLDTRELDPDLDD